MLLINSAGRSQLRPVMLGLGLCEPRLCFCLQLPVRLCHEGALQKGRAGAHRRLAQAYLQGRRQERLLAPPCRLLFSEGAALWTLGWFQ